MPWQFRWFRPGVNPDTGTAFLLSKAPERKVRFRSLIGASGPPFVPVNQEVPFKAGSILKFINVEAAEVDLRVLFQYDTQELLWATLADLPARFNPLNGAGVLQITNPAGHIRRLNSTCISGFKIDESTLQEKSVEAALTFYGNDPYWYSSTLSSQTLFPFGNTAEFFPIFPINLGPQDASQVFIHATNDGDVDTYPNFTIRGPGNNVQIINTSLEFNNQFPLTANGGIQITNGQNVSLDFLNKTVTKGASQTNQIDKLAINGTFFPLKPGNNVIQFTILNATANTRVIMEWRSAYSTMI